VSPRLPRGRHGVPRELIARNQRERLIAAMAEVVAERSYADTSATAVIKQAGVSRLTFYEHFANRRECMLATYQELFERLLVELDEACEAAAGRKAKLQAAIRTGLELLAADPPTARLLTVEILAAGPNAVELHYAAIEDLAARLRQGYGKEGSVTPFSIGTAWGLVSWMTMLVARCVMAGEADRLPELESELLEIAEAPHLL